MDGFDRVRDGLADLWRDGRGPVLVLISAGWFLSIGVRLLYPALLPHLRAAFGIDLTTAGMLLAALWVAYGLGQLPGGLMSDRLGYGRLMSLSTLLTAGTVGLVILVETVAALFVATVLLGLTTALYGVVRFTALSDIYDDRMGTATGVTMAAGDLGNALLPPFAGFVAVAVAWQFGFGFTIPLFLVVAVGLWVTVPASSRSTADDGRTSLETVSASIASFRRPQIVYGFVLLLLYEFVWQSFTGFYPTYLLERKELSTTIATGLFGLFFMCGVVVKPLAGAAYDRIGVRRSLVLVLGVSGGAFVALPFVEGTGQLLFVTVLASSMLGFSTVALSYVTVALPPAGRGTGLGILRTAYILLGASGPLVFGAVADRGYFDAAYVALGGIAVVLVLVVLQLPDS